MKTGKRPVRASLRHVVFANDSFDCTSVIAVSRRTLDSGVDDTGSPYRWKFTSAERKGKIVQEKKKLATENENEEKRKE